MGNCSPKSKVGRRVISGSKEERIRGGEKIRLVQGQASQGRKEGRKKGKKRGKKGGEKEGTISGRKGWSAVSNDAEKSKRINND